jgi:glycosidase
MLQKQDNLSQKSVKFHANLDENSPKFQGTESDLLALKKNLNDMGLQLMLDFVPNHSAVDAPAVKTNPMYYVHAPKNSQPDLNKYTQDGLAYGGFSSYTWQ